MAEIRSAYKILFGKPEQKTLLWRLGVNGMVILKSYLKNRI
jgi:hypothetical protein